ncbi:MAG TPA: hypothetical protein ENI92_06260 [Bacteroidetes bacterium]|nr:hypothetical protein [Bacteroidota bacterium]
MRLAVHLNPVAQMRRLGGGDVPDPLGAALAADLAGADGIACRLNLSREPISDRDIANLKEAIRSHLNVEVELQEDLLRTAIDLAPDQVTLVPPEGAEPEEGLDVVGYSHEIKDAVAMFHAAEIEVSLLVAPDISQIKEARRLESDYITLNTTAFAAARSPRDAVIHLEEIESGALGAHRLGMRVLVARGLDHRSLAPLAGFDTIEEAILDHRLYARALFVGLERALAEVRETVRWQTPRR